MEQQGRRAIGRVCPRGAESYTWQEGDTAERIARTYATTVQALQVINPGVDFATLTRGSTTTRPTATSRFARWTCTRRIWTVGKSCRMN